MGINSNTNTKSQGKAKLSEPKLYRVILHNDDYTPMDFVVGVLIDIFRKSPPEANRIMLNVHYKGAGVCGTYPYEIAETKIAKVHAGARADGYPLKASMEQI